MNMENETVHIEVSKYDEVASSVFKSVKTYLLIIRAKNYFNLSRVVFYPPTG